MMLMRDVPVGETVFLLERIGDEIRETFYERVGERVCIRRAVVQGEASLDDGACPWESGREAWRPRYVRFSLENYGYPLVGALPVLPLSESTFWRYLP